LNEQIFDLPINIDGITIFFLFDELDTISVYFGCPNPSTGTTSIDINAPGISQIKSVELVEDSWLFASFRDLLATFGCKFRQTVQSGSLIYFPSVESTLENLPLISYNLNDVSYSLVLNRDGNIYMNGTGAYAKLNTKTLRLNSDIYLYFRNDTIELYDSCTVDRNQSLGSWFVPVRGKFSIETSLENRIGTGSVQVLLDAFCAIQRISKSQILDNSVRFYQSFLPSSDSLQQIERFKSFLTIGNLGIDQLIQNEPRILIASRSNPKPEFFNRGIQDYIKGFSDGQNNTWIGLDLLNKVTQSGNYILRVEADTEYGKISEEYSFFRVGNRSSDFKIELDNIIIRDGYHFNSINENTFSTYDFGNNRFLAAQYSGGFWFSSNQSIHNVSCFTCQNENNTFSVSLAGNEDLRAFNFKLYLIPSSFASSLNIEYLSGSKIVEDAHELLKLIEFNNYNPNDFKLIYRATRDGFSAKSFFTRSRNKPRVLAIIRSGSNVFGGYTDLSWNGNNVYQYSYYRQDLNAFLFSYRNPKNTPALFKQTSYNYYSIYDSSSTLMSFGSGHDLSICSNANTNYCSYSNLGNSYQYYNSTGNGTIGYNPDTTYYFTNSYSFTVGEIELYQRSN
jgi:hypothetical protein